jgi:hypothetical protein
MEPAVEGGEDGRVAALESQLKALATGLAQTRAALDASRAELYDALHEGVTQARLEVASLAQQLRRTEAAVAQLVETRGGEVTAAPVPAPAPVRASLLDDLDRQLQEAETRLARRLSTGDR